MTGTRAHIDMESPKDNDKDKGSLWQTFKAVAWAFLGVRRGSDWHRDMRQLHPYQVILVGLVGVALFVGILVALVHFVVS